MDIRSRLHYVSFIRQVARTSLQGYGLGLDASVSRPSRGAVVPRLGLAWVEISNASVSPQPRD